MTNDELESLERLVDIAMELVQAHAETLDVECEVNSLKRQLNIEEIPGSGQGDRTLTESRHPMTESRGLF